MLLLEAHADIKASSEVPLCFSAMARMKKAIVAKIEDENRPQLETKISNEQIKIASKSGYTAVPLVIQSGGGKIEIIKALDLLISNKADLNAKTALGLTSLRLAIS